MRNVQEIKPDVKLRSGGVKTKIEEEAKMVKDLEQKAKSKCFIGFCPSIKSRYRLSKKPEEGASASVGLIRQCQFTGPKDTEDEPGKDFEAFESRQKVFNDIMEAMKDTSINMIGVYGMSGVGKSTLLKEVVRKVRKFKLFDWVVMVAVTENPVIVTIQDQIAESLGLKLEAENERGRAGELRQSLEEKRVLFVLDDLGAKLDFEKVGISSGNEENRCKMLLASRDQDVLLQSDGMHALNTFPINHLDEQEATDLFKRIIGESNISPELQTERNEIPKRCGGLPLPISTVALALKNKDQLDWTDALRQLQSPSRGLKDISPALYSAIELCYNHIERKELQQFFLFCSLLSHDFLIEILLRYTIGLGLLSGDYTVEEARNRLLTWVGNLKAAGLLLDSYSNERYDMHDIICNVAISIASIENNRVLALKQEDVLKDWPNVETMKQCSWINLRVASNMVLPDAVECPQLTFLLLEGKDHSIKVPTEFFKEMKKLKVLDLTAMDLSSFPSSISLLSSLQTLCLKQCYLGDITVVGELKALEILSLSNSDIEKLPKEIGQLVQLKVLDLRGCTRLKAILAGLLSRLTKLEELYIGESFARYWEAEDDASQRSNASVNELSSLSHLTTLEVHIRDAKMVLGNFLFFQKLKRYKIFIGDVWKYLFGDYQYSRTLKLQFKTLSSIDHLHHGIKMLLEKIEDLHVDGLKGVKIALHEFIDEKGFPHLKNLHIQNCSGIQYIIPGGIAAKRNEFLINLRSLTLKDLPKLISFCFGDGRGSASKTQHQCLPLFGDKMAFPFLTRLIIERCDNLKYLISASTARSLVHLKYLEVVGCKSLIEIIYMEDTLKAEINEVEETLLFPQLDSLKMRNLQLLRGFCSENYNFDFKSLKILEIHECPHFMGFIYNSAMDPSSSQAPFNKLEVVFPCLTRLTIFRCDNLKYLLSASTATSLVHLNYLRVEGCKSLTEIISKEGNVEEMVLPCLTILIIKHCDNLKYLLSASTATSLVHLKYFHIARCEGLKEIISTDQGNVEDDHIMTQIFPKLESFELKHLKELERFCRAKNQFKLSSLSSLAFKDCPSFKTFVSDSIMEEAEENKSEIDDFSNPLFKGKVALPLLKDLRIKKLENLKRIWDDQLAAHSFCNLENLVVDWCENLLSTFPFNVSARMQKLKKLEIRHCNSVEEIIEAQGINARESNVETIPEFEFPQVTSLLLDSLPRLKSLYYKMHISKWPSLEAIKVNRCDRVKIFASEYDEKLKDRNGEGEERQHQIQPLFWTTKDTFPCIKEVSLNWNGNLRDIWLGQLPANYTNLPSDKLQRLWHDRLPEMSCHLLNLKSLEVRGSAFLNNLFSLSVAEILVHLEVLLISDCRNVKEVIVMDKSVEEGRMIKVFPRLQTVWLGQLPKLVRFCCGDYIEFPMLSTLQIEECPQFTAFVSNEVNGVVHDVPCLFNDKVAFPRLQRLEFKFNCGKWKKIWHHKLTPNSFDELNLLSLYACDGLSSIFPFSMVDRLQKLETMKISSCDNLESIIEPCAINSNESSTKLFVFPQVSYVQLERLRQLKSFYPSMHTTEWPALKELEVKAYSNVKVFAPKNLNSQPDTLTGTEQPLFWFSKDAFPCLEVFDTDQADAMEIFKLNKNQESTIR